MSELISITKKQLSSLETVVVGYMLAVENEIELSGGDVRLAVLEIDKVWDSMFNVIEAPRSEWISVGALISSLRETDQYIETIYTQGGCYKFHLFLKSIFKDAAPYINNDDDHVVSLIGGKLFDINGEVNSDETYRALEDVKLAESWSFAGNMMLSAGECQHCEEPVLILPTATKGE